MSLPACVSDYREGARRRLPKLLFDYVDGGAYAEATLKRNIADLEALALRQRVMVDVSQRSTATELFGQAMSMPVVLAPIGMGGMLARRGEIQAARAAQAAGVPFTLSTVGICDMAEVTSKVTAPWFQLYMLRDRGYMAALLERARGLGCPVLVFTVDLPVPGARYRDRRNGLFGGSNAAAFNVRRALDGLSHPAWLWDVQLNGKPHTFGNIAAAVPDARGAAEFWPWVVNNFDTTVTWDDIAWVRERWPGPLVIKGVLDAEDAREARRCGVEGLVVSNHGGRQLDGVLSGIAALPAIADAVGDDLTVLMDGGVRSGLDVVKAMAAGAKGCLLGRAWAFALAARGEAGVAHMLEIVRQEMLTALALTGTPDIRKVDRSVLARAI
jgi:L-lactate dehydrogenase (cytochrome)